MFPTVAHGTLCHHPCRYRRVGNDLSKVTQLVCEELPFKPWHKPRNKAKSPVCSGALNAGSCLQLPTLLLGPTLSLTALRRRHQAARPPEAEDTKGAGPSDAGPFSCHPSSSQPYRRALRVWIPTARRRQRARSGGAGLGDQGELGGH